jgi:hypothetical protein
MTWVVDYLWTVDCSNQANDSCKILLGCISSGPPICSLKVTVQYEKLNNFRMHLQLIILSILVTLCFRIFE